RLVGLRAEDRPTAGALPPPFQGRPCGAREKCGKITLWMRGSRLTEGAALAIVAFRSTPCSLLLLPWLLARLSASQSRSSGSADVGISRLLPHLSACPRIV